MDIRQSNIYNCLKNAETDRHGFVYFSVNTGQCIFKVYRHHLENIIHVGGFAESTLQYFQIPNVYRYQNGWVENPFVWLHSIGDIYTMEETISYPWGNDIEYKRDYSLYRLVLFKLFIRSYSNDLRHRTWQPGTKHVKKLEAHFNSCVIY